MRAYLYKCDDCGNAKFTEGDEGNIRYYHCVGCKESTFHHKVVVRSVQYDVYEFYVLRGEKDDSKKETHEY